jgi:hypothetical protein
MFKIDVSDTYYFPVTVEQPIDGGKFQTSTFDAQFKRLSKTEIKDIFARLPVAGKEVENQLDDDGILDAVLVGWKGIEDSSGEALPYSITNRSALLDVQGVSNGIVQAYFASLSGRKTKN